MIQRIPVLLIIPLLITACQQVADKPAPPEAVVPSQRITDEVLQQPASDFDMANWVDLAVFAPQIRQDIKYATADNFVGKVLYPCGRCLLRPAVARQLLAVQQSLEPQGYGLLVHDCYRPLDVQWVMWEAIPDKRYVSDPNKGSMHNRGTAVDLTLVDAQGNVLDLGTPYDFFGPEAWPEYTSLPPEVLERRRVLAEAMVAQGFRPIRTEWWHFSLPGTGSPISSEVWPCQ
jgi:D-alanyl-D-alanine dipeptidase